MNDSIHSLRKGRKSHQHHPIAEGRWKRAHLQEWIAEMLLAIVNEPYACPELFATTLVAELANMAACLSRLAAIACLDDIGAATIRTIAALAGHHLRILVSDELAHKCAA